MEGFEETRRKNLKRLIMVGQYKRFVASSQSVVSSPRFVQSAIRPCQSAIRSVADSSLSVLDSSVFSPWSLLTTDSLQSSSSQFHRALTAV